jgi:hypothetical protein
MPFALKFILIILSGGNLTSPFFSFFLFFPTGGELGGGGVSNIDQWLSFVGFLLG